MPILTPSDILPALAAGVRFSIQKNGPANAEAANVTYSFWDRGTIPSSGSYLNCGVSGVVRGIADTPGIDTILRWVPGDETYLMNATVNVSNAGALHVFDLLWQSASINVATLGSFGIGSPVLPARDMNGSSLGANLELWLANFSADGTNAAVVTSTTVIYTNNSGQTGRVASIPSYPATPRANTMVRFVPQAGDTGYQKIDALLLGGSYGAGVFNLMLMRRIADLPIAQANLNVPFGPADIPMEKVFSGSCLHFAYTPSAAAVANINNTFFVFGIN